MGRFRLEVLGPLQAWRDDTEIPLGTPQQRAVLSMLALREGAVVSLDELVDGLWGDEPPNHAVAALRTYIGRLRGAIAREPGDPVVTSVGGGYRFTSDLDTDLADFERGLLDSDRTRAAGDLAGARAALLTALDLWRDEPLAGVPGPYARTQRARLTERRNTALEALLETDLALGDSREAITRLDALVGMYPLRERWHSLLMLALCDDGRREDALRVYTDFRERLDRELGCEPSADMRALYAGMRDEPTAGPEVRPAQLPTDVTDFTGREAQAEELRVALTGGPPAPLCVVTGTGGVGKTALAVSVAHAVRARFPDGQLYVDLRGAGPQPAKPDTVLAGFLHALGVPRSEVPSGVEDRSALFRSIVSTRRLLVVLDNARDAEQVEPLLPGGDGCAALVTGRGKFTRLPCRSVHLDVLTTEEAVALLTRLVCQSRVEAEPDAAREVVSACGLLPLAIRVIGARLASRPSWTIAALAERLTGERLRLRELRVGDAAVETTFDLGYAQLRPPQRRAFRLLAVIDGTRFTIPPASAILNLGDASTLTLVESLVDAGLLDEPAPRVYRFHDLVKLYARQRSATEDQHSERAQALEQLLDFALASVRNAYRAIEPESVLPVRIATASSGLPFDRAATARDWLTERHPVLLASTRRVAEDMTCRLRPAADLMLVAGLLLDGRVSGDQLDQTARIIADRADDESDAASAARAHVILGKVALENGRLAEAERHRERALDLSRRAGDYLLIATCTLASGVLAVENGDHAAAAEHLVEAANAYRAIDDPVGRLYALAYLARAQLGLGDHVAGAATAEAATRLAASVDPTGPATRTARRQLDAVVSALAAGDGR